MSVFYSLLRDSENFFHQIFDGEHLWSKASQLIIGCVAFFFIAGFVMGIYNSPLQAIAAGVKIPLLFLLSLIICFPALFVFNIILGSKLGILQSLVLIFAAYGIMACVLVSFAPIALFFIFIGSSYSFLRLLFVGIFAIAGFTGMLYLGKALQFGCEYNGVYPKQGIKIFRIWVVIFAFVGTQLAWNLRPFLGNKSMEFQLLRKQESNFYAHFIHTLGDFIAGEEQPPAKSQPDTEEQPANTQVDSLKFQNIIDTTITR